MAYAKDERRMIQANAWLSKEHHKKLLELSTSTGLTMSRLIAIAIDNEMFAKKPYQSFATFINAELQPYQEYEFAESAGKIVNYMRGLPSGLALDLMYILRHDIGIKDGLEFMHAFRECLKKGMLVEFEASPTSIKQRSSLGAVKLYRLKDNLPEVRKKVSKDVREFQQYEKLKKKFEGRK